MVVRFTNLLCSRDSEHGEVDWICDFVIRKIKNVFLLRTYRILCTLVPSTEVYSCPKSLAELHGWEHPEQAPVELAIGYKSHLVHKII